MNPPLSGPSTMAQPMYDVEAPHSNDVLSGRGVATNRHEGNTSFRSLVALNKELYVTSTKRQKMQISRSIVDAVRSMSPPGRFLEKNPNTGLWSDIGDRKAIEKTSQALRDGAAALRKQLSQDLGDPGFLSAVFDVDEVVLNESKSSPKEKAKPAKAKTVKKGHRRVRSNPDNVSKSKLAAKKAMKAAENRIPRTNLHQRSHPNSPMYARSIMGSQSFDETHVYLEPGMTSCGYSVTRTSSFESSWNGEAPVPPYQWQSFSPHRVGAPPSPSHPPPMSPHSRQWSPASFSGFQTPPISANRPPWVPSPVAPSSELSVPMLNRTNSSSSHKSIPLSPLRPSYCLINRATSWDSATPVETPPDFHPPPSPRTDRPPPKTLTPRVTSPATTAKEEVKKEESPRTLVIVNQVPDETRSDFKSEVEVLLADDAIRDADLLKPELLLPDLPDNMTYSDDGSLSPIPLEDDLLHFREMEV